MRLLDTDTLIDIQRGHQPAVGWFASLDELPSVPGFVAMELYQGAFDARRIIALRYIYSGRRVADRTMDLPFHLGGYITNNDYI